jgi:alpha-D-ribose 1-methylphosphonate 5-triphosphate synthase subunit PhnH
VSNCNKMAVTLSFISDVVALWMSNHLNKQNIFACVKFHRFIVSLAVESAVRLLIFVVLGDCDNKVSTFLPS